MATLDTTRSAFTLNEALELMTIDTLKPLLALVPGTATSTRKADLIAGVRSHLEGEPLRAMWNRLDETQRLAVAEAAYSDTGVFQPARFRAKYGVLPDYRVKTEKTRSYSGDPTPLCFFLYPSARYGSGALAMPWELGERLREFVPLPEAPKIPAVDELPEVYERVDREYHLQEGDPGMRIITRRGVYLRPTQKPVVTEAVQRVPLERRDTERDALGEILVALRAVDLGKLTVSEKTRLPGTAALRDLDGLLAGGDYYPSDAKVPDLEQVVGPIKAFAWPMLLQGAGMAELHGKKLALTKSGRAALGKPAAETLRSIWQRWLNTKDFDEFNRIDVIKGQQGKGKRSMTAVAGRRAVILKALRECPAGAWVSLDRFSRYMQAAGYDFGITHEPWTLYIADANYGSLGHAGYHDWHILQKRYLSCLLFEYAATLGMIDVAYVPPWEVEADFSQMWGTDDYAFLSRYDGLLWFRINPLGLFCLGLVDDYQPKALAAQARLSVLPSLQVRLAAGELAMEEGLFLDTWAEREDAGLWRLDKMKTLSAVESGRKIGELVEFLNARDAQGLPDTVEGFLAATARQASALKNTGPFLLIECSDAELAERLARHEQTKSLCRRAGDKHLAVKVEAEERFRKAVNGLGYGMPKV